MDITLKRFLPRRMMDIHSRWFALLARRNLEQIQGRGQQSCCSTVCFMTRQDGLRPKLILIHQYDCQWCSSLQKQVMMCGWETIEAPCLVNHMILLQQVIRSSGTSHGKQWEGMMSPRWLRKWRIYLASRRSSTLDIRKAQHRCLSHLQIRN